jgi:light-regulated signal transduction histidine kinase (bacteriophytochrome)
MARLAGVVIEHKQVQEEIRRLNAQLEQRVQDRTSQLQAANKELESFCYSVSHDLRAPLRSIDGFSRFLLEDYAARLDDEGRDSLRRVRAASQRMGHLIDDLLALSRTTRAELHRTPLDLSAVAQEVAAELAHAEPARNVEWAVTPGLTAEADAALLRLVLQNLLGNAWKFTGRLPQARIEFGRMKTADGPAFFVRDNGAGFDMAYANKLFAPFQRLHTTEEFAGTGVGLANVQRIIHRHGGRVWAESQVDHGATFFFTLPEPPKEP